MSVVVKTVDNNVIILLYTTFVKSLVSPLINMRKPENSDYYCFQVFLFTCGMGCNLIVRV